MRQSDVPCNRNRQASGWTESDTDCALIDLYSTAVTIYERAVAQVEQMIAAVQNGVACESQSVALKSLCGEIALVEQRILAANQELSVRHLPARHLLMAAAERHLMALGQLCDKVRSAEHVAAQHLRSLSPRLDASIRSKAMVSAYRQHRAS